MAEKRPIEREEVCLHKQTVAEEQQLTDTVRKERVVPDGVDETQRVIADYNADTSRDR